MRVFLVLLVIVGSAAIGRTQASITGKVTDRLSGAPIPEVRLLLTASGLESEVRTNAYGAFAFENLPATRGYLKITKDGYADLDLRSGEEVLISLPAGEVLIRNFQLTPSARIDGRAVDITDGKGVPSVAISLLKADYNQGVKRYVEAARTSSAVSGAFEFSAIGPGEYLLEAVVGKVTAGACSPSSESADSMVGYGRTFSPRANRISGAIPITIGPGLRTSVEIPLAKRILPAITGTLAFAGADFSADIEILIEEEGPGWFRTISRGTMKTVGPFCVAGISPGEYRIMAWVTAHGAERRLYGEYQVAVGDKDIGGVRILLDRGTLVRGTARLLEEEIKMPADVSFRLVPAYRTGIEGDAARVAASPVGMFEIAGVAVGDYILRPGLPPGFAVVSVKYQGIAVRGSIIHIGGSGAVDSNLVVEITGRPGYASGTVRDKTALPMPGALVVLLPQDIKGDLDIGALTFAASGEDGNFTFQDLSPGSYKAVVLIGEEQKSRRDLRLLRSKELKSTAFDVRAGQVAKVDIGPTL